MCNLDCLNCAYDDCINDGELSNAIRCREWYRKNKEKKKEYQRAYIATKRRNKALGINEPIHISPRKVKPLNGDFKACKRCNNKLPIKGRGLCNCCYVYAYRHGILEEYETTRTKNEQIS